jgi:hypothetical protein
VLRRTDSLDRPLTRLEENKLRFGPGEATRVEKLLDALSRHRFPDAKSLIRLHEALLFLRAFPQGPGVVRRTERLLTNFHRRVDELRASGGDMKAFEPMEVSGIAGTTMEDTLSFDVVRWLARHIPRNVEIEWDDYDEDRALAATWPRFLPLLEEDGYVEANIPWVRWLRAAKDGARDLEWLIGQFEQLSLPEGERAELYESLRLPVRWKLENLRFSRTRNWQQARPIYYHREPLIIRNHVLLERELAQSGPALKKLSLRQGRTVMDTIREVMAVRYRELYGTTLGDPSSVVRAEVGRGVVIYLWGLPAERRLPLRTYIAGFTLKNGVPINYIEAIGLCEWIEVGFNTFYTFRNGETAWIYAQGLRCLCRHMGTRCISVYPYQLGQKNDEAIESGAFWFYRKLGFRPGRGELLELTQREERRIAADPTYKTPARVLRRLAEGHVFYELPGSEAGAWDRFSTRNIGLRVNRRMAEEFGANEAIRRVSVAEVSWALGVQATRWSPAEQQAFENWALVLALVPDLGRWTPREKRDLVQIIRAKAGRDEMNYLRLTQGHTRLRRGVLRLGSPRSGPSAWEGARLRGL